MIAPPLPAEYPLNPLAPLLDRLRALLPAHVDVHTGMADDATLCGYLCAVITAPDPLMPSTWLPPIWGDAPPEVDETAQRAFVEQIVSLYQALLLQLAEPANQPAEHAFRLGLDLEMLQAEAGADLLGRWAMGFAVGQLQDEARWEEAAEERPQVEEVLLIIDELLPQPEPADDDDSEDVALEDADADAEDLELDELDELDDPEIEDPHPPISDALSLAEMRIVVVMELSTHLHDIQRYNHAQALAQQTHRRSGPKVGRNDPCPCGSGRKYKRCHGA